MNYPVGVPISNLADKEISELIAALTHEQEARVSLRRTKRIIWVNNMIMRACAHPTANWRTVGDVTVVAVYHRAYGVRMGTATPVHGDKYEADVGVAVAFAKAMDEEVPDYI